jgi:hypothetical protein
MKDKAGLSTLARGEESAAKKDPHAAEIMKAAAAQKNVDKVTNIAIRNSK